MQSELYALIQQHAPAAFAAGDDAAVCQALNTPSVLRRDSTLRTARWLIDTFGVPDAEKILGTLQASSSAVVKAGYDSLTSGGLDLSHPTTQALIDQLGAAGNWGADLAARLKAKGQWLTAPAGEAFGRDITLQDVAAARQWRQLTARAASAYTAVVDAIAAGQVASWEDAVTVFQAGS